MQREGRANFFIYNRTDLASGSHFAGRYESQGYRQSVEELINKDTSLKQVPLKQIWDNPQQYKVVSILQAKHRNETGGMGGGTMHQLFTWSEDATDCINDLLDFLYFQGFGDFNRHMGEYIGPYPTAVIPELWK